MRNYPEITGKKPIYAAVFPAGSRYSVAPGVTRHTVLAFAEAAHDLVAQMFQKIGDCGVTASLNGSLVFATAAISHALFANRSHQTVL